MRFFEYIFYRMYTAYSRKKDWPFLSTVIYMFVLKFMIVLLGLIITRHFLGDGDSFVQKLLHNEDWLFFLVTVLILILNHLLYFRNDMSEMEAKYVNTASWVKVWMLILLPFVILFGGVTLLSILT